MAKRQQPTRIKKPAVTLNKALGDSDNQAIRNAWKVLGAETPTRDVVAHLAAKGISVSSAQVSRTKAALFTEEPTGRNTLPTEAIGTRRRSTKKVAAAAERATEKKTVRSRSAASKKKSASRTKKKAKRRVQNSLRVPHA